eukprot:CAMPEP_0170502640 /NCGR_PEP_ID=MMETSP0208-20121228/42137_2 /TAXON_ID=197538 /ORGANISM="Strombidium inclinatum, Strain S3" /LENGTH=72 /DNA_ID=CAMNT_0010781823 /DNA_START=60 /DNA_END=278 /DNA_ORIENTATION=-
MELLEHGQSAGSLVQGELLDRELVLLQAGELGVVDQLVLFGLGLLGEKLVLALLEVELSDVRLSEDAVQIVS